MSEANDDAKWRGTGSEAISIKFGIDDGGGVSSGGGESYHVVVVSAEGIQDTSSQGLNTQIDVANPTSLEG